MDRDPFDLVGDVLDGQFRVVAFAGEGDLSVVYKGHHLGVDAPVAIKCLNLPETLDPALAKPLVDGFKEASRVHYKLARGNLHIAQTIASGSTLVPRSGHVVPYLVREWFEGESLASELARRRAEKLRGRPLDEVLDRLESAFDGIGYAHAQGEVHLSINPSNLFVVQETNGPTLKVLDFGVARTMNAFASGIPSGKGRPGAGLRLLFPAYAAPEQLDRTVGEMGPSTDVYAIALVMMEMLSDRLVMNETETGAIVEHALDEQRRPTPQAHGVSLPSHVDRALARAVARSPGRRQKNAAELWKDLRNTLRAASSRSLSAVPMPRASEMPAQAPTPLPSRVPSALQPFAAASPVAAATASRLAAAFASQVPASPGSRTPPPFPSQAPAALGSRTPPPFPSQAPAALPSRTPAPFPSRMPTPLPSRAPLPPSLHAHPPPGAAAPAGLNPHRMRAATLVGLSPPVLPVAVPEAMDVSNRTPSPSVTTKPMAFEPTFGAAAGLAQAAAPQAAATPPAMAPPPAVPPRMSYADATGALVDAAWAAIEVPAAEDAPRESESPLAGPADTLPPPENALALGATMLAPQSPFHLARQHDAEASALADLTSPLRQPTGPLDGSPRFDPPAGPPHVEPNALARPPSHAPVHAEVFAAPPAFADPVPRAPWSGGSVELPPRRYTNPFAYLVSPQGAPIVLSIAGGLFWLWAAGISIWLLTLPFHAKPADHDGATVAASTEPSAAIVAERSPPPPSPAVGVVATTADRPREVPSPATRPAPAAEAPAAEAAGSTFHNGAAIRALDRKWREIAKCRRGSAWGKASTTVTFAGDGSVMHVDVGAPFAGTPTGDCIADALSGARVDPFADKSAVVVYRVYVAPR